MWQWLLTISGVWLLAVSAFAADQKPKEVQMTGVLRTGAVAIGGETTGIVLVTKEGKFELDLGADKELRAEADKLNGKTVMVTGTLEVRKGVEVQERKIITVKHWKVADGK